MIKLSRSKIELLFECPWCFWFYAGKGIAQPFSAPYTINNAVDFLLKAEFDEHRNNGTAHYLIEREEIDAIPFMHEDIGDTPDSSDKCSYCSYVKETS